MAGFSIMEEPFFSDYLNKTVSDLLHSLKDPHLPLLEMQEVLSTTSGRIPQGLEEAIHCTLGHYSQNLTSVLCQFPSQQITNIINKHGASIQKRSENDQFFMNTSDIMELVRK